MGQYLYAKKYKKTKNFLLYTIIKHKFLFIMIIAITLIMVFICFPRNIGKLLVHSNNTTISIVKTGDYKQEAHEIPLNETQYIIYGKTFANEFISIIENKE